MIVSPHAPSALAGSYTQHVAVCKLSPVITDMDDNMSWWGDPRTPRDTECSPGIDAASAGSKKKLHVAESSLHATGPYKSLAKTGDERRRKASPQHHQPTLGRFT